jgi:Tol biopolymer transport system component
MFRADVFVWLPDGEVRVLSPGDGVYYQASVHPEGDHAVFWGGVSGAPRIWRADTNGDDPEPITPATSGARHPVYGLRGDRIFFTSDRARTEATEPVEEVNSAGVPTNGPPWHIFSMAPDGSDVRQVTQGNFVDQRPAVSPDGTTVAFVTNRGEAGIWMVDSEGTREPWPVVDGTVVYRPWWSVDGESIFCFMLLGDRRQVCRVSVADGGWSPLANDDRGSTHGPYADPAGDVLIVHSTRDGPWRLFELPLDGSPMRALIPPGHEETTCGHGTRARNGVLTFDVSSS